MMLDAGVVAVSPSSVYRVLRDVGLMRRHDTEPSRKGKGFHQPLLPHEHWHVDVSYINVAGTFFCLCSLLDGCSRFTADVLDAGACARRSDTPRAMWPTRIHAGSFARTILISVLGENRS